MNIKTKFENKIFLVLYPALLLIVIEGFLCRLRIPSFGVKYAFCKKSFFFNFWLENGFIENLQVILLIFSIYYLLKAKYLFSEQNLISIFLTFKILALIYYLGEEISWGQHFFKWNTPEWFLKNNNQKETNVHNITNLLDQLPRSLVLIWCTFVPLSMIFLKKFNKIKKNLLIIFFPNTKIIYLVITILIFVLPDLIVDKFNVNMSDGKMISRELSYDLDMITFNFLKLSELHELLFCFYFLFYSFSLYNYKMKIDYK